MHTGRFYTGVGSRETPDHVLDEIVNIAGWLALSGYTLRSGGAPGADTAFELGSLQGGCDPHVYLPWPGFNGSSQFNLRTRPTREAYAIGATVHPAWQALSSGARALHARNCHQVLGDDLATPSRFLVCWTSDGCDCEARRTRETGGTGTAIVLADRNSIPVFNLRNPGAREALDEFIAVDAGF